MTKRKVTRLNKAKVNYYLILNDLKQRDIAEEIGLTQGAINQAFLGANTSPATAYAIAKALGVDLEEILDNGKPMTF